MAEENSTTDGDSIDLEELIGNVLDSRGLTKKRFDALGGLGEKLDALIAGGSGKGSSEGGTPAPFDKDGFMKEIGDMIDGKIAASAPTPKEPPLKRWLKSA